MSRLADYFVIVGYDHSKTAGGVGVGKIIQRFPEKDWDNCPFTQGIELFCQPCGWSLGTQKQPPTFFVSVLTDIDAYRHYCACLTFSEDVVMETVAKEHVVDDDDSEDGSEDGEGVVRCSKLYAPKSLVLVSRLDCFEVFRNCLGIIYATYIDNLSISFEVLVANILTAVQIPPHGGPLVKFSIGAGDRQNIQLSSCPTLPNTGTSVSLLFEQLGISNCLTVFCAALCDHKVLFHSMSYSRLTDSSHALTSLMYPLKYSYVYVPLLPVGLLEVLSTPTPFIAGVHTSQKPDQSELLDVVVADLDGGSLKLPDNMHVSLMPQAMLCRMKHCLQQILRPDLTLADIAFSSSTPKLSSPEILDKEIRAIFLRFFAELFMHYRSCLNLIRINAEPVITFHKASFLGNQGLMDDDFLKRVLDSMSFNTFVVERGPPYRICDIFDDVLDKMHETLKVEQQFPDRSLQHVKELAEKLYANENPTQPTVVQKVPRPTEGSHLRVHQPLFPILDEVKVHALMQEGMSKWDTTSKFVKFNYLTQYPRIVPTGTRLTHSQVEKAQLVSTNARRLEVLRNCITFIFENKISDARKIIPAVLKVLKTKVARLLLVEELGFHVKSNRSLLEHQQFEMVVRLLNSALQQNDSVMDENGVATAILPLAMSFCRKLFTGVIQFAYTCVQDHPVWSSHQFWEAAFYQDVQQQISNDTTLRRNDSKRWSTFSLNPPNNAAHQRSIAALEIAAEQMRLWPNLSEEEKSEMIKNEESTVYSQAIHYANRMVYLRIPLDATKTPKDVMGMEGESLSSMVTNSAADSDSMDGESGIDDPDMNEIGANVTKFVLRFIDKVCMESGVSTDHIKSLHQMVPGVIDMHLETLEAIHQEIQRLPPMPKPRILAPVLLVGEEMLLEGLRAYLIPDGREEGTGGVMGGPAYLPAEGAIFLTSYRVIFKGTSCDPLVGEQSICRSFPISSLTKEKKLNAQYLNHKDLWMQEAVQLRSATFQMLKVAFDEEVSTDDIELLRKWLSQMRHPPSILLTFPFIRLHCAMPAMAKSKEKNVSLKNFAKKTLLKTARKAGIKTKDYSTSKRSTKYFLPTPPLNRKVPYNYNHLTLEYTDEQFHNYNDELSVIDEQEVKVQILNEAKNLERISERSYCRDFFRLGLGSLHSSSTHHPIRPRPDQFRLSTVNINSSYAVCFSYPAVLPVPYSISDDCLQKICKSHKLNRFPVATWRHPTTKALLIRGSGFYGKRVMGVFKGHYSNPAVDSNVASTMTMEQEKYFSSIISCTPPGKDTSTLSRSSMKGLRDKRPISAMTMGKKLQTESPVATPMKQQQNGFTLNTNSMMCDMSNSFYKSTLYVLGEKAQMKGLRVESLGKCDFVPIDFNEVRNVKASFKKLMRACVPSSNIPTTNATLGGQEQASNDGKRGGMLRWIQESGWMGQIENILKVAGLAIDLIDLQGSSVMICLEDGWDFTTQALSQILLDPYYRTIEGFKVLIEKEWMAFGHRFSHRSNQTEANQASGFAPIFLQFLDVVHQIHNQFPMSFEFNQFYLRFLAFHHLSNRFRTFMLDSELKRVELGWHTRDQNYRHDNDPNETDRNTPGAKNAFLSVWDYIDYYHKRSPVFYNFLYCSRDHETVLRPYSTCSNLKVWDYYFSESLCSGTLYDLELRDFDLQRDGGDHQDNISNACESPSKLMNGCYDNVEMLQPDSCSHLLMEIFKLNSELNNRPAPRGWIEQWESLEVPTHELSSAVSMATNHQSGGLWEEQRRRLAIQQSNHKKLAVRINFCYDVNSKMIFSHMHSFMPHYYTTPTQCNYCTQIVWGFIKSGYHCADCNYSCHEKCLSLVPQNCTGMISVDSLMNVMVACFFGRVGYSATRKEGSAETYLDFPTESNEHRTHEGYLYKRGVMLKGWKLRWFVLDSVKHQLRYYDSPEDAHCKGFVDLADVVSVANIKNVPGAPKKSDDGSFFELKTIRRVYHFYATDSNSVQDWIDKIQLCI
ncbi:hypothetical protein HELRODRAFT_77859 [Helobdella robusta]|uniref:Myotubularin-related protein 13 n=1 Tax=Helobdella robusta TaxID=6412 RepID=T1G348_HELRO|nr:hypothetical protein HELRODRAFT_77859 [Helobdella robusta]ESO05166.1 hypothetical protein HELRODRAFT_77859 [Helobdella robusta]